MQNRDINVIRKENKENKNKKDNSVKIVAIASATILLSLFLINYGKQTLIWAISSLPLKQPVPVVVIDKLKEAKKSLEFKYSWETINFNKEKNLYLNLNLINKYEKNITNIEIVCTPDYGTPIINKLKVTIFETIPSHNTKDILQYNFGQLTDNAKNVTCEITDLSIEK